MASPSALVLAACGLLLVRGAPAADLGDTMAAVQSSVEAHRQQAGSRAGAGSLLVSRARMLAELNASQGWSPLDLIFKPFDCKATPKFCKKPFSCDTYSPMENLGILTQGMAATGKANLRVWCAAPQYEPYVSKCIVDKDLVKAATIQYDWTVRQHSGTEELDGSYCFIEGHCSNDAVTNSTTLEESYQMCDDRYGHDGWTKFAQLQMAPEILRGSTTPGYMDTKNGFRHTAATKVFLKAACAMGNYHCDVMYCKETYCKMPYYIKKYGHLLPRTPGHLIQQRDAV